MADYPTLSINPCYPLEEEREDSTIKSEFEGGYQLTRPRFSRIRRKFGIKYEYLPDSDKSSLDSFIETVKGGADSFNWTHPKTSVQHTVRFDKPPVFRYVHYGRWNTEFVLVEV